MSTKSTVKRELERLVIHANDSVKGYEKAAERVQNEDANLALCFREIESNRRERVAALNSRLECIGEEEKDRGSLEGTTHRALISVKDLFTSSQNTDAVVDEAIRGEEKLIDYIQDTFDDVEALDGETTRAIHDLKHCVQGAIDRLRLKIKAA
ncbi:PA2169 family four-helix-bundle protein [Coraliomargarita sp. SDUM461004]|uniref:PA2169 family four-helix-bundle protein n=1 Tax=Thalassobacterium sedimentorum TaxID=3041258 RepID=A0ABU1AI45_9BACT|nr:PA2169 family four-helix-bundle protein [Coraliomargarita sp. SDUM461004]MDQ8194460.1 PA2169 family four-helix-bundle protein [Coraliomargarita sp. SDUM461004]